MTAKIPLIYVLSNGRSGSTLLELMLNTHPAIWTVGEAHQLPWELRRRMTGCGCGTAVGECDFWKPLLARIPLDADVPIDWFREGHGTGRVLRWAHLARIAGLGSRHLDQPMEQYADTNWRYLSTVKEAAEAHAGRPMRWLVDASKCPYRLFWLGQSDLFDIRIVHLMKGPRGFVYSMTKQRLPKRDLEQLRITVRMSGRWLVENSIMSAACSAFDHSQWLRVQYEELAGDPRGALDRIGNWLGLSFPDNAVSDFREFENHGIGGNEMRGKNTPIRLDEKWRRHLPGPYAHIAWGTTWPLARRYGYQR